MRDDPLPSKSQQHIVFIDCWWYWTLYPTAFLPASIAAASTEPTNKQVGNFSCIVTAAISNII